MDKLMALDIRKSLGKQEPEKPIHLYPDHENQ